MPVILTILVILQSGLIITGGAVRLTGSGLGCPTWPQCTKGSFKPIAHQAQGQLHAWIEFGNRLLTFVLFFVAVAAVIMTIRASINRFDKRRVRLLAIFQLNSWSRCPRRNHGTYSSQSDSRGRTFSLNYRTYCWGDLVAPTNA